MRTVTSQIGRIGIIYRTLSPWKRLIIAEEPAGGAIVGQCRCPDDSRSALVNRTWRTSAAHIGCDPSWAHGVYKNVSVTKLSCESTRQRIQSGLGDLIRRRTSTHVRQRSGF